MENNRIEVVRVCTKYISRNYIASDYNNIYFIMTIVKWAGNGGYYD